jgi:hypothetical protein
MWNKERVYPEITKLQEEFLIGCVLGDGTLQKQPTSRYPEFTCSHGEKQFEYALWKSKILNWPNTYLKQFKRQTPNKKTGKYYSYCYLRSIVNKNLVDLYNEFYNNKKKRITETIMNKYTPLSLAVHYMDDGYIQSNSYGFATCCFDDQSIEIFRKYLYTKFGIETTKQKGNRVRIRRNSIEKMTILIEPFVNQISCMSYKLIKTSHNSVNCLGNLEGGNQQPSPRSNTGKGSTTSSESQEDNNSTTKAEQFIDWKKQILLSEYKLKI